MKIKFKGKSTEWELKEGTKVKVKPLGVPDAESKARRFNLNPLAMEPPAPVTAPAGQKREFQFHKTKSTEFPMKTVKVEIEPDRLDEILLVYHIFNNDEDVYAIERGLAEYRTGTDAVKVAWLEKVLVELNGRIDFFARLLDIATRITYGPEGDPLPIVKRQHEWIARKIESLKSGQAMAPAEVPSEQVPPVQEVEIDESLITGSSDLYHHIRKTVEAGDFDISGAEGDWPRKTIETHRTKADVVLKPHEELEYNPRMGPEELKLWQERMAGEVRKLGDEAADVLDVLAITWLDQAKDPKERVWVRVDDILRMRGLKPRKQGGYKKEHKERIGQHIARLGHLYVRVFEVDRVEEVTTPAGKTKTVRKRGRINNGTGFIESAPFVVTSRAGQQLLFGGIEYTAFRIQLGDVLAPFFFGPGRQVAMLSAKALHYDPFRQRAEKRLTRYFSWQWRIRALEGNLLQPFKVKTLVAETGLKRDRQNPARPVERLEKALDTLAEDGVIAAWQYQDGFDVPYTERGYWEKWLAAAVVVEPPQAILDHSARLRSAGKKALPAETKPKAFDPARLKTVRRNRGLTQLQAAEEIQALIAHKGAKSKLSQAYFSMLEAGKKEPTGTLKNVLAEWCEKGE